MVKDIYKDERVVRYKVKCQECAQTFLVYEIFAPIPEHPDLSSKGPYKPCPLCAYPAGSRTSNMVIGPAGRLDLWLPTFFKPIGP